MTHARTQIRQAVIALLKGNTSAKSRVHEARVYPISEPKLPAIMVYTNSETAEDWIISKPRTQMRRLSLTIEAYAKQPGAVDAVADGLALEIEKLVATDTTLGGIAKDTMLDSTEIQLTGDGEKPVAGIVLTYTVMYAVKENTPDVIA